MHAVCRGVRERRSDGEEGGDGLALVDAADGFGEEGGDTDDVDFIALGLWDGVGGDDFFDSGGGDAFVGEFAENGVGDAGEDAACAVFV